MTTCADCKFSDPINEIDGKCKVKEAERKIKPTDGCVTEILNGWPVIKLAENSCGRFSPGIPA